MGRVFAMALVFLVGVSSARADGPPEKTLEQQARAHFQLGLNHFKLGEYETAIADFEAGYRLKPLPLFLFNAALAAMKGGQSEKALELFQRYIGSETRPNAPELDQARQQLEKLQKALRDAPPPARPQTPPPTTQPPPAPIQPPPTTAAPQSNSESAPVAAVVAQPERPRRWYQKGWVWGTIVGVVVVGVGLGVGLGLGLEQSPPKPTITIPF